jgi:hypothetical protein
MFIDISFLFLLKEILNLIVIYFITNSMDESELFLFIRNAVCMFF